jgi:hypothetical protein
MGYRLSQYNQGYMILDASQRYVGAQEDGTYREMTLEQVANWIAAESGSQSRAPMTDGPAHDG